MGEGKVILHENSSLMFKIVVDGYIQLIHKYYPIPCSLGKHLVLKS